MDAGPRLAAPEPPAATEEPPEVSAGAERRYLEAARSFGFEPVFKWPWAICGASERIQGWKLHLSATPEDAPAFLERVLPILKSAGAAFKFAASPSLLGSLNEGEIGATQIGKFVTVYPDDDDHAARLAEELVRATDGFSGPVVQTDLALGGQVFARFGGVNPVVRRDRLGGFNKYLRDPQGDLVPDDYTIPADYPAWAPDPFKGRDLPALKRRAGASDPAAQTKKRSHLFGPGFLVLQTLKAHGKGSVFLAVDLRSQEQVALKVLKQGRKHCLSDASGRDIRDRLKRQSATSEALAGLSFLPRAEEYFEVNGDGYLVVEYIDGQSLEVLIYGLHEDRPWADLAAADRKRLLVLYRDFVAAVARLHDRGYVHRDLTASNLWVGDDGRVYLLDLELAHPVADKTPAFGLGTTGFMSPSQASRRPPELADDVYALGCVLVLLLTGIDPRRVPVATATESPAARWTALAPGVPGPLVALIEECTAGEAARRPRLDRTLAVVDEAIDGCGNDRSRPPPAVAELAFLLDGGLRGLVEGTAVDAATGLWVSPAFDTEQSRAGNATLVGDFEIRRSANRGVAGPVIAIARLRKAGIENEAATRRAEAAISWLLSDAPAPDSGMPGLHFGDAGVALALAEACSADLVEAAAIEARIDRLLAGPLDWPDITHGAAGQGLAALHCAALLDNPELLATAERCTRYLLDSQAGDGSWIMPEGMPGMSGQTLPGFAHGIAGMAFYLLRYADEAGQATAKRAAVGALDWLIDERRPTADGRSVNWPYSDTNDEEWRWWCHGGPGIALAFLEAYRMTGEARYAATARHALAIHPERLLYPNLSACHGLAGIGEIYLEAHRALGDDDFLTRARAIATTLEGFAYEDRDGAVVWRTEDPLTPFADLMVGTGGILHFLLNLLRPELNYGFPLLRRGVA